MKQLFYFLIVMLLIVIIHSLSLSQMPQILSFQGVLTDTLGNPKPDGSYIITFRLYESSVGGNEIWSEQENVQLKRGLINSILGDQNPFGLDVRFNKPYWLSLQIGSEPELSPRIPLTAVGYSFYSLKSDTAIVASTIPNGIVTESKIADNSVSSIKIMDGTITARDLASGSVTSDKIPSGQVVKSLNGLRDNVFLSATGGATINASNDTIYINAGSGGGGTGIQGIQNTNNTISITNPNGPTSTINLKIPLSLQDTLNNIIIPQPTERGVLKVTNSGSGSSFYGYQDGSGKAVYGLSVGTGRAGLFAIDNASNSQPALTGLTNGSGNAVYAYQSGAGIATYARINNSSNSNPAFKSETNGSGPSVYAYQTGTGNAGHFQIDNANNYNPALKVETNGSSNAAHFLITNASNTNPVIKAETYGTGYAFYANKSGTGDVINLTNSSNNGSVGTFRITNSSNTKDALVVSTNGSGHALYATAGGGGAAVKGYCTSLSGRAGWFQIANVSSNGHAIVAETNGSGVGVWARNLTSNDGVGVFGEGKRRGVVGYTTATSCGAGIAGLSDNSDAWSGYFDHDVYVYGSVEGGFACYKIDHPFDPENQYLKHSYVGSNERMNIYTGTVTLDDKGEATVKLPDWFETLNDKLTYQLTCIGGYANVYVSEKVNKNQFKISGGFPGLEVSWQITGVRKDPFSMKNSFTVEEDKKCEKGTYIFPEAFGKSPELSINAWMMSNIPKELSLSDEMNTSEPESESPSEP